MNFRTLFLPFFTALLLLAWPSPDALGQSTKDGKSLDLKIARPAEGGSYWLVEPNVMLAVEVSELRLLRELEIEVAGEETGIFFSACSEEDKACRTESRRRVIEISCPVFEGKNVITVRAIDTRGKETLATARINVAMAPADLPPEFARPMLQAVAAVLPPPPDPDRRDNYDLLILTHKDLNGEDFAGALQPLVQHKNNTGMPTVMLTLEEIYEIPAYRGFDHPEIIKKAIADAAHKWKIKYVMLVGDSDRFPVRYTRIYDLGHWGHGFAPSDLYYADLFKAGGGFDSWDFDNDGLYGEMQGNFSVNANDLNQDRINLVPDVAVGRVPVSSRQELLNYVQKVIQYETTADSSWFKNALLVTGDYPGSNGTNDDIGSQLASRSFQLNKQYHDAVWPGTVEDQRWPILEGIIDNGVGFISYVGHGGGAGSGKDGGLWGGWYRHSRIPFLNNQDRLPIIFSAACSTGLFHYGGGPYFAKWGYIHTTPVEPPRYRWAPEPISFSPEIYDKDSLAEHFLVKGLQGGIAFIGAYTGTQGESHILAKDFFSAYASGIDVLGDAWNKALEKFANNVIANLGYPGNSWRTAARYHHIHKMLLFGDPSLRMGGLLSNLVPEPDANGNFCRASDDKLLVTVANRGMGTAGASTTQVDFFRYGKVTAATMVLSAGQTQDLLFEIPEGCFDTDCNFRITVDVAADVAETSETDNSVNKGCVG